MHRVLRGERQGGEGDESAGEGVQGADGHRMLGVRDVAVAGSARDDGV